MRKEQAERLLALVKRNYDEIAAGFDATRKKEIWPEMKSFASRIEDGARILDAGCGNGRLLEALKGKAVSYLGIDNSHGLIKAAHDNYPSYEFREADILNMENVPEKGFDHIFSLAVLQHIPGQELQIGFLKNLAAKLKPGGDMVISVWNMARQPKYRRMIWVNRLKKIFGRYGLGVRDLIFPWKDSSGKAVSDRYYHAFTARELGRLCAAAGLEIAEMREDRHNIWVRLEQR